MLLRDATWNDEQRIHQLFCVPEVFEYLADGVQPPPEVAPAWIDAAAADRAAYGGGLWVLIERPDGPMCGLVRLAGDDNGELELTYLIYPDLWGRGLATRMAHTAMMQAFAAERAAVIWAGSDRPNTRSIAVMERLGMQIRREVQYPMGPGVEYQIAARDFDAARIEPLAFE